MSTTKQGAVLRFDNIEYVRALGRRHKREDRYLAQQVNFGGEMMSRADVYRWFWENDFPQRAAEMWLMGNQT